MKTFIHIAAVMLLPLVILSCNKSERKIQIDSDGFSAEIKRSNSSKNYKTTIEKADLNRKIAMWRMKEDGSIQLTKQVLYDVTLKNGQEVTMGFWFIAYETEAELLNLSGGEDDLAYHKTWSYVNPADEKAHFYEGFREARVEINSNVIYHSSTNEHFTLDLKTTEDQGIEKNFVSIKFDGTAFGGYDPEGKYQEVFKIEKGRFEGFMD